MLALHDCVSPRFGVNGAGMAFFGSYVFHGLLIYPIVRALSGFRWSAANRKAALVYISLIAGVFCGVTLLPDVLAYGIGTLALILSALYSIRVLLNLVSWGHIPRPVRRLLALVRSTQTRRTR